MLEARENASEKVAIGFSFDLVQEVVRVFYTNHTTG